MILLKEVNIKNGEEVNKGDILYKIALVLNIIGIIATVANVVMGMYIILNKA